MNVNVSFHNFLYLHTHLFRFLFFSSSLYQRKWRLLFTNLSVVILLGTLFTLYWHFSKKNNENKLWTDTRYWCEHDQSNKYFVIFLFLSISAIGFSFFFFSFFLLICILIFTALFFFDFDWWSNILKLYY